jgi:hypothetical protein
MWRASVWGELLVIRACGLTCRCRPGVQNEHDTGYSVHVHESGCGEYGVDGIDLPCQQRKGGTTRFE